MKTDENAKAVAATIRQKFWDEYESALSPKRCSKRAYLEELEELAGEVESRIECVRDELQAEEGET